MTRENKAGLVVSGSFLILIGTVLAVRLHEAPVDVDPGGVAENSGRSVAMSVPSAGDPERRPEKPAPAAPVEKPSKPAPAAEKPAGDGLPKVDVLESMRPAPVAAAPTKGDSLPTIHPDANNEDDDKPAKPAPEKRQLARADDKPAPASPSKGELGSTPAASPLPPPPGVGSPSSPLPGTPPLPAVIPPAGDLVPPLPGVTPPPPAPVGDKKPDAPAAGKPLATPVSATADAVKNTADAVKDAPRTSRIRRRTRSRTRKGPGQGSAQRCGGCPRCSAASGRRGAAAAGSDAADRGQGR
ncbi:MAG: hypothetical protein U0736_23155 [Gemmataceae bacterium]